MKRKHLLITLLGASVLLLINITKLFFRSFEYGSPELSMILFSSFISIFNGGLIGFLTSLLIYRRKNLILFGSVLGFMFPLVYSTIMGIFQYESIYLIRLWYILPMYQIFGIFALFPYVASLFYAIIGGLIGWIYSPMRNLLSKNKMIRYLLLIFVIVILLLPLIKSPQIEISHDIITETVNPVAYPAYIKIKQNELSSPFISLKKISIEQDGEVILQKDISTEGSYSSGYIKHTATKVQIDPVEIFRNDIDKSRKETLTINVYYTRYGIEYKESLDVPIEIVTPLPEITPVPDDGLSFETISKGAPLSGHLEKEDYVIREFSDWEGLWDKVHATRYPKPELPDLNFNNEMILAVFQGSQPTTGYNIDITRVVEKDNYVEVFVKETHPAPKSINLQAFTYPHHI